MRDTILLDVETIAAEASDPAVRVVAERAHAKALQVAIGDGLDPAAAEREAARLSASALDGLALSPWTARVVSVALWSMERRAGRVFYDLGAKETSPTVDGWTLQGVECEHDVLVEVWSRLFGVDICTWNGLDFDQPMLAVRGMVLGVAIDKTLLEAKPWESRHLDLCAKTAMGFKGKAALEVAAAALGIPSPKQTMSGKDVGPMWAAGRKREVALYNAGDVSTLRDVLSYWRIATQGKQA